MQKHNDAKCGQCKGTPGQHNVRNAEIRVSTNDGLTFKIYRQHPFVFAGR